MTISEIKNFLKTSFKNGVYIKRPFFNGIYLYINKDGVVWQFQHDLVMKIELMKHELTISDWEIIP